MAGHPSAPGGPVLHGDMLSLHAVRSGPFDQIVKDDQSAEKLPPGRFSILTKNLHKGKITLIKRKNKES